MNKAETKVYQGWITIRDYGDSSAVLFLKDHEDPLIKELDWISGKNVSVRYWITPKACTSEEADVEYMKIVLGDANAEFDVHYSEQTGYLWTDEELIIGGHDLLQELTSYVGHYLILEIS